MRLFRKSSVWSILPCLILLVFAVHHVLVAAETTAANELSTHDDLHDDGHGDSHPFHATLFPSFILSIGVVVFYVLSRFAPSLPYTGIMFIIGTIMGVVTVARGDDTPSNDLKESLRTWMSIDGEVLLLTFLPGLIFRDAYSQNPHLFWVCSRAISIGPYSMKHGTNLFFNFSIIY